MNEAANNNELGIPTSSTVQSSVSHNQETINTLTTTNDMSEEEAEENIGDVVAPLKGKAPLFATASEIAASKDKAIANLLEIVAQNNISINENLRRAILGEELYNEAECKAIRRQTFSKRESVLGALVRSHTDEVSSSATETAIAKEIREMLDKGKGLEKKFELRIKDGSYTVDAPVLPSGDKPGEQHIETVTNSGACYKLTQAMKRLTTTGKLKQKTESKTIMEGVNLVLEEGKMYLILGAPGCGKSTCECMFLIVLFVHIICTTHSHIDFSLLCHLSYILKYIIQCLK